MSFGIDVNNLLYASDESSPLHDKAANFLYRCVDGGEVFCLAWVTLMTYMRMATRPAIFDRPLSHEEAARNIETLLATSFCRVIGEEDEFWDVYRKVTKDVPAKGSLVPDAQLAALLSQHGVVKLYTR